MSCYSTSDTDGNRATLKVISPTGSTRAGKDAWIAQFHDTLLDAGWTADEVKSVVVLSMLDDYFGYFPIFNQYFFWNIGPPTANGQLILANKNSDGSNPANPSDPYYTFWRLMSPTPDRHEVMSNVVDFWIQHGWSDISGFLDAPPGDPPSGGPDIYVVMQAPGWNNTTETIGTGASIKCNADGNHAYGGGFVFTNNDDFAPLSAYLTQVKDHEELPSPKMRIGKTISIDPFHPIFNREGKIGWRDASGFGEIHGDSHDTVLYVNPLIFILNTQTSISQAPIDFACAVSIKRLDGDGAISTARYGCISTEFGTLSRSFRSTLQMRQPSQFWVELNNTFIRDGDSDPLPSNNNKSLVLNVKSIVRQNINDVILWQGADDHPNPGFISEAWAAINPFQDATLGSAIVGQLPDTIVVYDIYSDPDVTTLFAWDNKKWKVYTRNNVGGFNAPSGTICFRIDSSETPYIPSEDIDGAIPPIEVHANVGKIVSVLYVPPDTAFISGVPDTDWSMAWCKGRITRDATVDPGHIVFFSSGGATDNNFFWQPSELDGESQYFYFTMFIVGSGIKLNSNCRTAFPKGVVQKFKLIVHKAPFINAAENTLLAAINQSYPVPNSANVPILEGWDPYTFNLIGGAYPIGMSLNGDGTWTGRPSTAGNYSFTISFLDALGDNGNRGLLVGQRTLKIDVAAAAVDFATVVPSNQHGKVGVPFTNIGGSTVTWPGHGGVGPYTYSITGGTFPPGLTVFAFDNYTAGISGTPTSDARFTFTIRITDSLGAFAEVTADILIDP